MLKRLLLMLAVGIAANAWSDTETVDGITWTYTVSNGVASLGNTAIPQSTTGAITIPSTLGGYPVTSIGNYAFQGCSELTSVTIPGSVTSIGSGAFWGCSGLTSVTIPDSVTNIGNHTFYNCSGLTSVTIPNSVTSIGDSAFEGCNSLTSVTIPDSVTSIGESAFRGCSGLANDAGFVIVRDVIYDYDGDNYNVTIPDGITSIGSGAFSGCSGLTSVTIPGSVTSIGRAAFQGCRGLTSVTIPNSVTSIGYAAFAYCSGLASVTIPNSVTSIGASAFTGCSGLTEFVVSEGNPNYKSELRLLLTKDGTTLIAGVNGDVAIPNGVTSIGDGAFWGCSGLTSVTIPNSVTSIEGYAFYDCSGLTSVTFKGNAPEVGNQAFSGIADGCVVWIPNGDETYVVTDGKWQGMTVAYYPEFTIVDGVLTKVDLHGATEVTIPDGVTNIANNAFRECKLTSVTIPDSVTSIGRYAFFGCSGLTSVTIPDSVTSIGSYAFNGCSGLANEDGLVIVRDVVYGYYGDGDKVTIPDSVTNIGEDAFFGCSGLTSVTIPDSVTSIGNQAFYNCSSLVDIKLTDSVTQYGTSCFEGCPAYTLALYRALFGGGNGTAQKNEVALTVTNVVVHYVSTSTQNDWVAPMDAGFVNIVGEVGAGSAVAIAPTWAEKYEGFADRFGTDFTAALTKETGKRDAAGNKMFVWQDYVAGTDPTKEDDVFTASITFDADGKPQIAYSPEFADPDEAAKRKYTTYGKVKLNDQAWTEIPEGEEENYNFFKVKVEMR